MGLKQSIPSRRAFLQAAAAGVSLTVLAACGSGRNPLSRFRAPPTPEVRNLRFLIASEYQFLYEVVNLERPWAEFRPYWPLQFVEEGLDNLPETAARDAAAGQSSFDGILAVSFPPESGAWLQEELLQPWEQYIADSSVAGAEQVTAALPASIRNLVSDRGQVMGLPITASSISLAWLREPLAAAGVTEPPISWDEAWTAARALQDTSTLLPFDRLFSPLGDLVAMIWGAKADPYSVEGTIDWESEEAVWALQWLQDMVGAELMPEQERGVDAWMGGRTGMILGVDLHSSLTKFNLGPDAAAAGRNLRLDPGLPQAGTPFWVQAMTVSRFALNPQGVADFGLWWLGPDNVAYQRRIADYAPKPAYAYVYADPLMAGTEYDWQRQAMSDIAESVPLPQYPLFSAETDIIGAWTARALDWNEGLSAREALKAAMSEVRTLHATGL